MRGKDDTLARQRQLPLGDEQIWNALPESTRRECWALFEELLRETLKREDLRENERQD